MQVGQNIFSHTNTFGGGMFKDTNLILQPDGTYRDLRNFQVINHDGNNFTIKDALGNRLIFTLPKAYNTITTGPTVVTYQTAPMPIGFISFPDRLIVFHANNESSGGYGEIGQLFLTNIGQSIAPDPQSITVGANTWTFDGYVPLYNHVDLDFSKMFKIEGFAFPENDNVGRVYWSDNNNEPRVFDTLNPIFTTYFASGGLVTGDEYMVISGAITHNATIYGIGLATGNVFTAANANYTITDGQALVIKYYPIQLLDWQPSRSMGNIHFDSYGTGSVYCGSKMYFYRLKSTQASYNTSWSYGCYPIHVGVQNSIITTDPYHDFVGNGSQTTLVASNKSVKVTIDNIDTNFDIIELACAEYDQLADVPRLISIVQQATITAAEMTLEHFGTDNFGTLTLDDITLFPASILKVKTLTTNKNYNIIANITEREEFDFDNSAVTVTAIQYPMLVHGDDTACANGYLYQNQGPVVGAAPSAVNGIEPWTRWLVTGGTFNVDYVEYPIASGNRYGVGQALGSVFTGTGVSVGYTLVGTPTIRPCVNINRYTTNTSRPRNNAVEIKTGFWDYKDPLVASMVRGYWSHEKYRFGILFYDKKGNPFYVKHLKDYTMPVISQKNGLMISSSYLGTTQWNLNPSIVEFSGITITPAIAAQISGFSIVRAERDARIVTQGLVMPNVRQTVGLITEVRPSPIIVPTFDGGFTALAENTFSYIVPDSLVGFPLRENIGIVGDKLEEAAWLDGKTWSGAYMRSGNNNYDTYAKLFIPAASDTGNPNTLRITSILNWVNITEANAVVNWPVAGYDFHNYGLQVYSSANITEVTCTSGPPGATVSLNGGRGVGGKKIIVYASDFTAYGQYPAGYGYTNGIPGNPGNNQYKILMNYVRDLPNPYGGAGEQALANTLYISTGHYQPINATVLSETLSAGNYVFNNVQVAGGDCFTVLADQGYVTSDTSYGNTYSLGLYFPCECNTNYNLRRGRKVSNSGMGVGPVFSTGVSWNPSVLEDYSYNPGYSGEGDTFAYPALPVNFLSTDRFPVRARFAGQKIIGESIDSFRTFLTNDYLDVDSQLGEINNVKAKGDYVYYWQNHGTGSMPILERQLISATQGNATSLGTGGVLSRFDTISTKYGNQHQWGLTDTEYGWIWFDMRNKDVCIMGFGGAVQEITVPTGMKSYFSEVFLERLTELFDGAYLNSQTFAASSDRPLLGTGIVGVYDPKNKMSYLTFKFRQYYNTGDPSSYLNYQPVNKDFTIGFSHVINKFIGFYDKMPAIWHNHNQSVLSANNPKNIQVYYGSDMNTPTPVALGDVIKDSVNEYICTTAGTVSVFATPPSSSLFTRINTTNEIYIENEEKAYVTTLNGYEYNKFYGRVVDNSIDFVVNPKTEQAFSVDNQLQVGNTVNFNQFYYETETKSASDVNVKSWNRNYELVDEGWNNNLPISTTGKLSGFYNLVRLVKKNWTTVPTTVTTSQKILQKVKSFLKLRF